MFEILRQAWIEISSTLVILSFFTDLPTAFSEVSQKPSLAIWISPNFFFIHPSKCIWVLSVKRLFFFKPELPEWGPNCLPPFCFSNVFPAHYLREGACSPDLRASLLSACPAEFLLVSPALRSSTVSVHSIRDPHWPWFCSQTVSQLFTSSYTFSSHSSPFIHLPDTFL